MRRFFLHQKSTIRKSSDSFKEKILKAQARARDVLIETAFRLFASQGYHQTTNEQIVKEARLSNGLLLYHFKNKEGLLHAIIDGTMPEIRKIARLPHNLSDPAAAFEQIIQQYLYSFQEQRLFWQFYGQLMLRPDTREKVLAGGMGSFLKNLRLMLTGIFEKMEIEDVEGAVATFETMMQGVLWGVLTEGDFDLEEAGRLVWERALTTKDS